MCQSTHTCERDKCPAKSVQGPTVKCVKCHRTFYLLCFGFSKCGAVGIKYKTSFNSHIAIDPSKIVFTCGGCDAVFLEDAVNNTIEAERKKLIQEKADVKSTMSTPNTSKISNDRPTSNVELKKDLMNITTIVKQIKQSIGVHSDDLASIKQLSMDIAKNVSNGSAANVLITESVDAIATTPKPTSFSQIVNEQRLLNRQTTARKRPAAAMKTPTNRPRNLPPQKMGTRAIQSDLKVVSAPQRQQIQKPNFDKSIHVSRIDKSVTLEMINEYISQNSQLKQTENFRCSLLVKKDKDVTTLTFVSFKVDVNSEHFDILNDVNFWPEGVLIREFIPKTKTLADFMEGRLQPNKMSKSDEADSKNEASSLNNVDQTISSEVIAAPKFPHNVNQENDSILNETEPTHMDIAS